MPITLTQIFLATFLLFALSRVFLRLKSSELSLFGFIFWSGIFGLAMVVVLFRFDKQYCQNVRDR